MRKWGWVAGVVAMYGLAGCKVEQKTAAPTNIAEPAPVTTTDLLAQGSPRACTDASVKETLLSMVRPDTAEAKALANAGSYPFRSGDVDGFAAAINLDLQLVTLSAVDRAVHSVTCNGQIAIAAPAYGLSAPSPLNLEYQVRPSIEDPSSFIVSGRTGLAKMASQEMLGQVLQQVVAHANDAAAQRAFAQAASAPPTLPNTSPSFNCGKVTSAVLRTVCGNDDLIALDNQLTAAYQAALTRADASGDDSARSGLIGDERAWIGRRQQCTDTQCIRDAYNDRIGELGGA